MHHHTSYDQVWQVGAGLYAWKVYTPEEEQLETYIGDLEANTF